MSTSPRSPLGGWNVVALLATGLASGFFSGLFGIGGGLVIVPALVTALRMDHRRAVGTSLLAILPAVLSATVSYLLVGQIDWVLGGLLAAGAVVGAQAGIWVLHRISRRAAQWVFVGFVVVMVVQLAVAVPERGVALVLDPVKVAGLLVLGLAGGMMSAILGLGGGGLVVPVLMVWFGLSDLIAKGASLVMMLPGVASGLVGNLRRHDVDVRAGLTIGATAILTGPLGAWVARLVQPRVAAWLFAAFLVVVGTSMAREALRPSRTT